MAQAPKRIRLYENFTPQLSETNDASSQTPPPGPPIREMKVSTLDLNKDYSSQLDMFTRFPGQYPIYEDIDHLVLVHDTPYSLHPSLIGILRYFTSVVSVSFESDTKKSEDMVKPVLDIVKPKHLKLYDFPELECMLEKGDYSYILALTTDFATIEMPGDTFLEYFPNLQVLYVKYDETSYEEAISETLEDGRDLFIDLLTKLCRKGVDVSVELNELCDEYVTDFYRQLQSVVKECPSLKFTGLYINLFECPYDMLESLLSATKKMDKLSIQPIFPLNKSEWKKMALISKYAKDVRTLLLDFDANKDVRRGLRYFVNCPVQTLSLGRYPNNRSKICHMIFPYVKELFVLSSKLPKDLKNLEKCYPSLKKIKFDTIVETDIQQLRELSILLTERKYEVQYRLPHYYQEIMDRMFDRS